MWHKQQKQTSTNAIPKRQTSSWVKNENTAKKNSSFKGEHYSDVNTEYILNMTLWMVCNIFEWLSFSNRDHIVIVGWVWNTAMWPDRTSCCPKYINCKDGQPQTPFTHTPLHQISCFSFSFCLFLYFSNRSPGIYLCVFTEYTDKNVVPLIFSHGEWAETFSVIAVKRNRKLLHLNIVMNIAFAVFKHSR